MVYCTKCGTENEDHARVCIQCGTRLETSLEERFERGVEQWGEDFGKRMENWGEDFGKRVEEECFGLPQGGSIVGIIFGVMIILLGSFWLLGIDIEFWPFIIIIFGVIIIAGGLFKITRGR